ncbi:Class I SAM-dependent methyltransferase [Planctomycetales bacterium 10988]|nr:Class I SAM-dependent methyltransferase [Planctomycetales bacterium 10988]
MFQLQSSSRLFAFFGLAMLCLPPVSFGQRSEEESSIPPAPTHFMGREIATTMHYSGAPWLVRESRQREEDCRQLLAALNVKPGQNICDLGCGNGFYSLQLAEMVGEEGTIFCVDIQPEMLRFLQARAEAEEIGNCELLLGTPIDPKLPEGEVDLILLVDVYHEISHPQQMLREMRKSLKPEGRIALVEFRLEDPDVPIKLLHKMSQKQMKKEFTSNGFQLLETYDKLPWQHLHFYGLTEGE